MPTGLLTRNSPCPAHQGSHPIRYCRTGEGKAALEGQQMHSQEETRRLVEEAIRDGRLVLPGNAAEPPALLTHDPLTGLVQVKWPDDVPEATAQALHGLVKSYPAPIAPDDVARLQGGLQAILDIPVPIRERVLRVLRDDGTALCGKCNGECSRQCPEDALCDACHDLTGRTACRTLPPRPPLAPGSLANHPSAPRAAQEP